MFLRYLTLVEYPSRLANRLQIMKMSEAFSRISDFVLFVKKVPENVSDLFRAYHVASGFRIHTVRPLRYVFWPQSFLYALSYRELIGRESRGTVFYVRDALLAFFLSYLSSAFQQNFFFELHSLEKFPTYIYRRIFQKAKGIISTNDGKKTEVVEKYRVSPQKILVAPNGYDEDLFSGVPARRDARRCLGLDKEAVIVMYVGSMQKWKGAGMIWDLARDFSDVQFVIVGGEKSFMRENVTVIEPRPYSDIPFYLSAADFLIAPYDLSDARVLRRFSPIKIVEYMASGTPIIATDAPSIRELTGGDGALLVSPYSYNAFCDALRYALENPEKMRENALRSKKRTKSYSWRARAESIVQFIQSKT